MAKKWAFKDPNEVVDYELDWAPRLGTLDTIATVTWIVPAGIIKDSQSNTTTVAVIWLSGGTAGETYNVVCRITTVGGRTYDQTVSLPVKDR
jgi:hypothetical protein